MVAEARARGIEIRCLESYDELREVEDIQREVWQMDPLEIVPGAQLRAVEHGGGLVAGAFADGEMVGFVYGFLAAPSGPGMHGPGMHSHMLAVRHAGRGLGIGKALKWFQRDWCLQRGIGWVCWTFDPLQAKNARLNLFHLGAISNEYLVDFYGPMTGPLGGNQETDRILALWLLDDPGVRAIAEGGEPRSYAARHPSSGPEVWLARGGPAGPDYLAREQSEELVANAPRDAILRVAAPPDAVRLLEQEPERAGAWRRRIRSAMLPALKAGFSVVDFDSGAYALRVVEGSETAT